MDRPSNGGGSNRRTFLKTTGGIALTAAIAGCMGNGGNGNGNGTGNGDGNGNGNGNGNGSGDDDPIRFILNPAEEQTDIVEEYTPMKEYLEAETGAEIELIRAGSYVETLTALETNQAELADTSPTAVPGGEGFADVVGMRTAFGGPRYFSTIVTTADSDIEELAALEGEQVTVGSALSLSGTLVPTLMLNDAGLDVGSFPDGDANDLTIQTAGDHDTARIQMINDDNILAAGTGAFSSAPQVPQEQFDEYPEFVEHSAEYDGAGSAIDDENPELQLLAVSDPLPRAPIMARRNWEDPVRSDLEDALLAAEEEDLVPEDVDDEYELWFTGIEDADRSDYEPVGDALDELGLEFEDFS